VFQNQISDCQKRRVMKRSRSKPHSFEDQLAEAAAKLEAQARKLRPGKQRDELLQKLRQIEAAANLNHWLKSPGLRPPT
jgi:hypothetical protein